MSESRRSRNSGGGGRRRSRSRSSRRGGQTSIRRLDRKICKLLKDGTDAVLGSLWEFSNRNPRNMELNCDNLRRMEIRELTREMDDMEGLEDLLERRGVRPFKFLGGYFGNTASHGYMKFGKYMLGGSLDCLASVKEVYEKTLKQLGHDVLDDEISKTERTWTSMTGHEETRKKPRDQPMRGGESSRGGGEPSFVTSHTQVKTHVSVLPDDSVSNVFSRQQLSGGHAKDREQTTQQNNSQEQPHITTNITRDKLAQLRNRPSTVDHLEQTREQEREEQASATPQFAARPFRPEHLKPLRPTLTVDRAPVRFSAMGLGLKAGASSAHSVRTVGQSEQATSFPARAPSTLSTHRPSFPDAASQRQEKLSQIHIVSHREPEQYASQLVQQSAVSAPSSQRKTLSRDDFDLQSDLHTSVYRNSIDRLQKSIGQLRSTGLIREEEDPSAPQ